MNRSYLLASGIALGLAVTPALAQTTIPFIDYVGVGLAISDVEDFDDGAALVLNAGKELRAVPGLSVEGEFTTTVDEPQAEVGGSKADISYWTIGAYGAYTLPIATQFDLRGRLGLLYLEKSIDSNVPGADEDEGDLQASAGIGANFNMTNRVAFTADYTYIDDEINHYGLGVKFRF